MKNMISKRVEEAFNFRINEEEKSSRLYLAMSNWFDFNGCVGAAKLWKKYSDEELVHAGWSYDYLLSLNIRPKMKDISIDEQIYDSFKSVIELSLSHEKLITEQCNELVKICLEEGDHMSATIAYQYCKEQIDELSKMFTWLDKLELFGDSGSALKLIDEEMGAA